MTGILNIPKMEVIRIVQKMTGNARKGNDYSPFKMYLNTIKLL